MPPAQGPRTDPEMDSDALSSLREASLAKGGEGSQMEGKELHQDVV